MPIFSTLCVVIRLDLLNGTLRNSLVLHSNCLYYRANCVNSPKSLPYVSIISYLCSKKVNLLKQ